MNIAVRPVIQINGRYPERRILIHLVIAPHGVGGIHRAERLFPALRRHERKLRLPGGRKSVGLLIHKLRKRPRHVMHKRRQTHRPASHLEDRLRLWPSAHHVHMHHRLDPFGKLRPGVQERDRAFNLRRPDKPNRPRRPRQLPLGNQFLQRPRDFQNRYATARIVVGSRALMIQVAGKCNLLVFQPNIGSWNRRRHHLIVPRMLPRPRDRMQPNLFALRQTFPQSPRRL